MNGTVLHFFGRALTGQGMKNLYRDLIKEAKTVYLFKGAHGFKTSELLLDIGKHYEKLNVDIEYFYDPLFEGTIEAVFVKGPYNLLFLHGIISTLESNLRSHDKVITFYDCLDEQKLKAKASKIVELNEEREKWYKKCFASLKSAIEIHDDWEVETQRHMDWDGLNKKIEQLFQTLFKEESLKERGKETHRLLGTLTPTGAQDTLQSITQNIEHRYFIKGYPGTGKSSMMKRLAEEALKRGYDVQKVWCGLDANSIDMVIIPKLNFCIFDSTEPHEYFPDLNRPGDQIFDIAQYCHPTEVEEENIKNIVVKYKSAIYDAIAYANLYAEAEREIREIVDNAINDARFNKKTEFLFKTKK